MSRTLPIATVCTPLSRRVETSLVDILCSISRICFLSLANCLRFDRTSRFRRFDPFALRSMLADSLALSLFW